MTMYSYAQVPDVDKMSVDQRVLLGACFDLRIIVIVAPKLEWMTEGDLLEIARELRPGESEESRKNWAAFWCGIAVAAGLLELKTVDSLKPWYMIKRIEI